MVREGYDELFRSAELVVRRNAAFGAALCVVTFDSFTDDPDLDRIAFGEDFLRVRGVDAIHVLTRGNQWYQYPEMEAAMARVHAATRGYDRVVTYGSSMGGYAAIRLAGLAGAQCAIALSPQFSIDPALVPFERRWAEYSARFEPVWEGRLPPPVLDEAYLFYDPGNPDARHIALFAGFFAFTPVALPFAGHPVGGFLSEIGLLPSAILSICKGAFDIAEIASEAWRRKEQSPQYFLARAEAAVGLPQRLALLEEALPLAPLHPAVLSRRAVELDRAKRFPEALECHEKVLALYPDHPGRLMLYSFALQHSGDLAAAVAVMDKVSLITHRAMPYERRRRRLRARLRLQLLFLRPLGACIRWGQTLWQACLPPLGQRR